MPGIYQYKDRGPVSSKEYNERLRDTSQELVDLLGKVTAAEAEIDSMSMLYTVEHMAYSNMTEAMSARLDAANDTIAAGSTAFKKICPLFDTRNVKNTGANGEAITNLLSWEPDTGMVVLPYDNRTSKLGFRASNSEWVIDPATKVAWSFSGPGADSNDPLRAIDNKKSTAFVVSTADNTTNNDLSFFVSVPSETVSGALVNYIEIDPAPRASLSLINVSYTTRVGAALDDMDPDQWEDLWVVPDTNPSASEKRFRAPQDGNIDTAQQSMGPRRYYFGERRITAVKVVLRAAADPIDPGTGEEYFVGIRHLDVGHVTFAQSGKRVFEFSLPASTKALTDITPRFVNQSVSEDEIDGVGSSSPIMSVYRYSSNSWIPYVIGDTISAGLDDVRVEITLSLADNGCTPILTGFDLDYRRS